MMIRRASRSLSLVARRMMSGGQVRSEGSVAQSKGFAAKEKAQEDQYVHMQEVEKLKKLRETIEAAKKEIEAADASLKAAEEEHAKTK
ncbi:hypothetical protein EXIGLDRAFT_838500 [Exidia glandulosa HHB12029]|uniref:ATPase inhibitor, mitochondrial n=1 Tax=Exidia glandulosa HHB12029 TaxID=1314781 RepID=A0A165FSR8_EXIGL|nr:hypothetical protein EXIGLDRAFT_838500 [Exidia glandulosa HHB12029]